MVRYATPMLVCCAVAVPALLLLSFLIGTHMPLTSRLAAGVIVGCIVGGLAARRPTA